MINDAVLGKHETVPSFEKAFALAKEEIDRALFRAPLMIRKYTRYLLQAKGKFIRATSLIVCAQKKDGNINISAAKIAAAIEILHLATLVHDDVMDDADIRRGIPTLQKKFGKRTAVICGDYLLSAALKMTASVAEDYPEPDLQEWNAQEKERGDFARLNLPNYVARICLGELNQHINNGNLDLSVYQYLKIISGKTAALFEASFCAGAMLSDCTQREIKNYRRLGRQVGMIFQLMDDCMDFESTEGIAKKPVQSDFEQKVITLPLIGALRKLDGFREKVKTTSVSRREINEAVEMAGGIGYAKSFAKKYYEKSLRMIRELDISGDKEDALLSIVKQVMRES